MTRIFTPPSPNEILYVIVSNHVPSSVQKTEFRIKVWVYPSKYIESLNLVSFNLLVSM